MKILIRNRQSCRRLDKNRITRVSRRILSHIKLPKAELSILFVGDREMARLNAEYRNVNRTTDVLSFDASVPIKEGDACNVLGDIVISVPKAEIQADAYGLGFYEEIRRLLIHGILHLTGYDHERSQYQERKMRKKEREIFHATQEMDTKH